MGSEAASGEWQVFRPWYNSRVMETNISAPIVDKQGDLIPTSTLKESMDYYMKFGIYSYKHEEMPIGLPLAYRVKDGRIQLRVGIHDKLDMHNRVWDEIKSYGPRGASSIRGEALDQKQICTSPGKCFNKIDKLGLWSVSWVGDNPANPEATVQSVSMSKGCGCEACGDEKSLRNDHENDYDDFEHIKEADCPDCGLELEEVAKVFDCPDCGLPPQPMEKARAPPDLQTALNDIEKWAYKAQKAAERFGRIEWELSRINLYIDGVAKKLAPYARKRFGGQQPLSGIVLVNPINIKKALKQLKIADKTIEPAWRTIPELEARAQAGAKALFRAGNDIRNSELPRGRR